MSALSAAIAAWPPGLPRKLAVVPFGLLAVVVAHKAQVDALPECLWLCFVALALAGVGLLLRHALLSRIAALQLVVGIPLWLIGVVADSGTSAVSTLAHLGGFVLACVMLRQLGCPTRVWPQAFGTVVLLQLACHWLTPERFNVNMAHATYAAPWAPNYAVYWLLSASLLIALLWSAERMAQLLWRHRHV